MSTSMMPMKNQLNKETGFFTERFVIYLFGVEHI